MSTTELRDLRTGCSIWDAYPTTEASAAALAQSTRADVVILGAGITGALDFLEVTLVDIQLWTPSQGANVCLLTERTVWIPSCLCSGGKVVDPINRIVRQKGSTQCAEINPLGIFIPGSWPIAAIVEVEPVYVCVGFHLSGPQFVHKKRA